jgi:hypothetical protein
MPRQRGQEGRVLIHWKKVACGAFFETLHRSRPAKGVTFAGLRSGVNRP